MNLSNAIYRLSKLARVIDVDGCEDDVTALNMAVDLMTETLRGEQFSVSVSRKVMPPVGRKGNQSRGFLFDSLKANLK